MMSKNFLLFIICKKGNLYRLDFLSPNTPPYSWHNVQFSVWNIWSLKWVMTERINGTVNLTLILHMGPTIKTYNSFLNTYIYGIYNDGLCFTCELLIPCNLIRWEICQKFYYNCFINNIVPLYERYIV